MSLIDLLSELFNKEQMVFLHLSEYFVVFFLPVDSGDN